MVLRSKGAIPPPNSSKPYGKSKEVHPVQDRWSPAVWRWPAATHLWHWWPCPSMSHGLRAPEQRDGTWWDRVSENFTESPCAEVSGITWEDIASLCDYVWGSSGGTDDMKWYAISFHNFPYASHGCNLNRLLGVCLCLGQWLRKGLIVNALWISWLACTIRRPSGPQRYDGISPKPGLHANQQSKSPFVMIHRDHSWSITSIIAYHWDPLALAHCWSAAQLRWETLKIQVAARLVL